jgi:hypothetical protein
MKKLTLFLAPGIRVVFCSQSPKEPNKVLKFEDWNGRSSHSLSSDSQLTTQVMSIQAGSRIEVSKNFGHSRGLSEEAILQYKNVYIND